MAASINSTRTCQALADLEPVYPLSIVTNRSLGLQLDRHGDGPRRGRHAAHSVGTSAVAPIGTARRVTGAVATETLVDGDRRRPRQPTWAISLDGNSRCAERGPAGPNANH